MDKTADPAAREIGIRIARRREALGMTLPGDALIPAVYAARLRDAFESGRKIVDLCRKGITARRIITRESIRNAIRMCMAICGSTNDLASTLGIPRDVKEATDLIKNGHINSYDIGLFNNRYYSYVAAFGAFTRSSYATKQWMKNMFGHFAYILNGFFKEWKNINSTHMKIEYDGGDLEGDFSFGSISNSTSISGIFRLNKREVKLNDGYFEVLLVRKARVAEAPSLLNKIRKKEYDGKRIILLKTSQVKITVERPIAWTLDGEYGGEHQTVHMNVLSKAIDICSPSDNILFVRSEEPATAETAKD